jgi:hypothetical protein
MRKILTPELFDKYKTVKSSKGFTFSNAIQVLARARISAYMPLLLLSRVVESAHASGLGFRV